MGGRGAEQQNREHAGVFQGFDGNRLHKKTPFLRRQNPAGPQLGRNLREVNRKNYYSMFYTEPAGNHWSDDSLMMSGLFTGNLGGRNPQMPGNIGARDDFPDPNNQPGAPRQ
jgi:hypothetical protein